MLARYLTRGFVGCVATAPRHRKRVSSAVIRLKEMADRRQGGETRADPQCQALVPIEQVVDADCQRLHVTIVDGDHVVRSEETVRWHGKTFIAQTEEIVLKS
jgi:hypothetical protein